MQIDTRMQATEVTNAADQRVLAVAGRALEAGVGSLSAALGCSSAMRSTARPAAGAHPETATGRHLCLRVERAADRSGEGPAPEVLRCLLPQALLAGTPNAGDPVSAPDLARAFWAGAAAALAELTGEYDWQSAPADMVDAVSEHELSAAGPLVALSFSVAMDDGEIADGWLMLDPATAERWNGGALDQSLAKQPEQALVPAALRGRLAAYVAQSEVIPPLRTTCRLVGLEVDWRTAAEVPNPAEHKEGIVLMDVPSGDLRRFDWCKRLKAYQPAVRVALMIHHPTRSRVLQGFLAKADLIVGWPIDDSDLAQRLSAMLDASADRRDEQPATAPP
jgi:hypothetical protein